MKTAITLIEIVVVMAIIAVLVGLGLIGMNIFRRTAQLQSAYNDLSSNLSSYRNMARNSVPSVRKPGATDIDRIVDSYAVFFSNNDYHLYYCEDTGNILNQYSCENTPGLIERPNEKSGDHAAISISLRAIDLPRCSGILFERKTGSMYSMSSVLAAPQATGECRINVEHTENGNVKTMIVDLTSNNFSIV